MAKAKLPRLVAIDLDGTLIGDNFAISQRNSFALSRAFAAGIEIVLATGRSLRSLPRVYMELGAHYLAICTNGAVVYDPSQNIIRDCWALDQALVNEVCQRLLERLRDVIFAAEVDFGRRQLHDPKWPFHPDSQNSAFSVGLDELTRTQAVKLQAFAPGYDSDSFNEIVIDTVGDLVEVTRVGYGGLIEMTKQGVTKATALAALSAKLNIPPSDTLAFGDMPNDIPMLRWAGQSVAVANAHPEVRAAANEITLSNESDGVATYLENLLSCLT
jgi:Cof subfamily protein (haloacid dehalogenase superfamily)